MENQIQSFELVQLIVSIEVQEILEKKGFPYPFSNFLNRTENESRIGTIPHPSNFSNSNKI